RLFMSQAPRLVMGDLTGCSVRRLVRAFDREALIQRGRFLEIARRERVDGSTLQREARGVSFDAAARTCQRRITGFRGGRCEPRLVSSERCDRLRAGRADGWRCLRGSCWDDRALKGI